MGSTFPLRILLAEDNPVNQKVGLLMLSRLGYEADLAVNGLKALEAIEKKGYDLVLMDIQMPEMNGIEASRLSRERLGAECPIIVALTAEALQDDRERFLRAGFDGYLSKPLQAHKLEQMLKDLQLRLRPLAARINRATRTDSEGENRSALYSTRAAFSLPHP